MIIINGPGLTNPYGIFWEKVNQFIATDKKLLRKEVFAAPLAPEAAIGQTTCSDYALQKGKERLLQAEIDGYRGQAFTDSPGYYRGKFEDVLNLSLADNFERAVFIAVFNALLRSKGVIQKSVHCRDESPARCALLLTEYIRERFTSPKVVLIGYQPRFAETLAASFPLRINDLDSDNIGKKIEGIKEIAIEPSTAAGKNMKWADLIIVTGSVIVNNTFSSFGDSRKPVLYFGTSIVGPAQVLGLNHFCPLSD